MEKPDIYLKSKSVQISTFSKLMKVEHYNSILEHYEIYCLFNHLEKKFYKMSIFDMEVINFKNIYRFT